MPISWRPNLDKTTLVTDDVKMLSIKEFPPPEGMKCILANRQAGTSTTGEWNKNDTFYTHWFPFPTFEKGVADQNSP